MRGNAPCGVKGVMGYALSARGIFAQRKNAECINRGLRFPRALPWAMGNIWAYSPPQSFTGRLCKLVALIAEPQPILCKGKENKAMCRVFTLPAMFFVGRIRQSFPL